MTFSLIIRQKVWNLWNIKETQKRDEAKTMTGKHTEKVRAEKAEKSHAASKPIKDVKRTFKHWVAVGLFGAIITVFALWGVNPNQLGDASGGVAAVVNNHVITISDYRNRVENIERNAKMRFDEFPEAQRKAFTEELRRRALEDLIMAEVMYQAASSRGVLAPNLEVRDYILEIPFLNENGRFIKDRYTTFLQNMKISPDDFERQIRKQIVGQKVQNLFVGSAAPTALEVKNSQLLANQKLNLRFVEIRESDLNRAGLITDAEVAEFIKTKNGEIETYYKANLTEFTHQDKAQARHILIRIDEKQTEAQAKKIATDLHRKVTADNFAKLAAENSDDPGSKTKGGDLGEFERGRMVPEFEKAAFALKDGQISEPVKTNFGYHIIYMQKMIPGGVTPQVQAQKDIAKKLIARGKQGETLNQVKAIVSKGSKSEVDAWLGKSGIKWQESGEFDLATPSNPLLRENSNILQTVMKKSKTTGIVRELLRTRDGHAVVEVVSWKEKSDPKMDLNGIERNLAYRKSNEMLEAWAKEITEKADIQRNSQLTRR